jgi:hypothetical protein
MSDKNPIGDWLRLSTAISYLWAEAATVVGLRTWLLLTRQPDACDESVRMIIEKYRANVDLAKRFAESKSLSPASAAQMSVDHYGKIVTANRRRLTRSKSSRVSR